MRAIRGPELSRAVLNKEAAPQRGNWGFLVIQDAYLEYDPADYSGLLSSWAQGKADIFHGHASQAIGRTGSSTLGLRPVIGYFCFPTAYEHTVWLGNLFQCFTERLSSPSPIEENH